MTRCAWIIGAFLLTSQSAAAQWRMKTESGGLRGPDPTSLAAITGSPYQDRRAQLLAKLTHATTFEVELHTHGRGDPIATFEIPNHDVLERFVASCQKS